MAWPADDESVAPATFALTLHPSYWKDMDLYSRQIVGWATRSTTTSDLVLQALLAAVWKRKPGPGVMVHSDQGSQFTGDDWQSFLKPLDRPEFHRHSRAV